MLTFVIGRRMDIYALIYAFWLCGMFALDRPKLSKIWISLRWFLVGSIFVQYLTFVGLPPRLCIGSYWNEVYNLTVPLHNFLKLIFRLSMGNKFNGWLPNMGTFTR